MSLKEVLTKRIDEINQEISVLTTEYEQISDNSENDEDQDINLLNEIEKEKEKNEILKISEKYLDNNMIVENEHDEEVLNNLTKEFETLKQESITLNDDIHQLDLTLNNATIKRKEMIKNKFGDKKLQEYEHLLQVNSSLDEKISFKEHEIENIIKKLIIHKKY